TKYLAQQSFPVDCIPDAQVTHIWTQDKKISENIAIASKIKHVVNNFEDMIDKVDAVLLARDDPESHLEMSLPFLDAGLPIYIDKPIAIDSKVLEAILKHEKYPGQIFSCSALRFAQEFNISQSDREELGDIKYIEASTGKSWEKYGVHIVEPVLNILKLSGDDSGVRVTNLGDKKNVFADLGGTTVKFSTLGDVQTPITIDLHGTKSMRKLVFQDTFSAFKRALEVFIEGFTKRQQMITHGELRRIVSLIERGMV
ncbi:MAG: Gfo/Idh/MocA family oxidoreductase, partial [Myxococcaceae bacterium]